MSRKYLTIGVITIIAIVLMAFVVFGGKTNAPGTSQISPSPSTEDASQIAAREFSMQEVALHNTATNCWTVINGGVYDLTSFIPRHEGGEEILRACGIDGTTLFTERKTTDGETVGTGTPHDSSAEAQLQSLKIGVVAQ